MTMTTEATVQYTRKDYMAGVCDHETYYRQFVNSAVVALVEHGIGRDKVMASKDEHLNDIALAKWDALSSGGRHLPTMRLVADANGTGGVSLSDCGCVLKAAAQMMREGLV